MYSSETAEALFLDEVNKLFNKNIHELGLEPCGIEGEQRLK
jgi:hypothetical protein